MTLPPPAAAPQRAASHPGAGWALILLLAINLFNYIDRQVLSAVLPKLELDADLFRPDDPWLKFKLGWLTTAFLVSYMVMSPLFGRLGDRYSRWALVGIGVIVWSLASGGSGLAVSFAVLLLTRCLVGIGEAAYGPVAPAMLSDMYPERIRGQVMAWFYMAIPVGSALGFVIGGLIADTSWGWRGAFQVVVLPGILLGMVCFAMKEPPRRQSEPTGLSEPWPTVLRELRRIRSFVLCCAGMTCTTFVLGGVAAWAPYYIFEREARFEITPEALAELAARTASDGSRLVPPATIEKLHALADDRVLTSAELKDRLAAGGLDDHERRQYQGRIFESVVWRQYAVTDALLARLEREARAGTAEIPPELMARLRSLSRTDALTAAQLRRKLRDEAGLTEEEWRTYGGAVFRSFAVGGSISLGTVGTIFGGIVVISGLLATLAGGWLGDYFRDRVRGSYFRVCGYGALVAFPPFVAMLYIPFPYAWICIFLAVFFLFINTGPANTILANVTRSPIRATAFAINILVIHLLGDAISPPLIGLIADLSNLGLSLLLVSFLILAAGVLWTLGAQYLDEETRRITQAES